MPAGKAYAPSPSRFFHACKRLTNILRAKGRSRPLAAGGLAHLMQLEERTLLSATPLDTENLVEISITSPAVPPAQTTAPAQTSNVPAAESQPPVESETLDEKRQSTVDQLSTSVDSSAEWNGAASGQSVESDQTPRRELVFIDPAVPYHQQLIDDLRTSAPAERSFEIVVLDGGQDGIDQISDILAGASGFDAVHIVSHGAAGAVKLGNTWLDVDDLSAREQDFRDWGRALSADADILFYGCDLAGDPAGRRLLEGIQELTGADVAASVDRTGSSSFGGNWEFEYTTSRIETPAAFSANVQQTWSGALDGTTLTPQAESLINTTTVGTQETSQESGGSHRAVAMDPNGNYVVVWSSLGEDGDGWGVYGRLFNRSGTPISAEFQINQQTGDNQRWATVDMADDGSFVVAWTSANEDDAASSVYARRFDASGNPLGNEFRVNTTAGGVQKNPSIAVNASGAFVLVWEGEGPGDTDGIFGRRYDAAGNALDGQEFLVNTDLSQAHVAPAVSLNDAGAFVVVWNNAAGIQGRRYDASGSPLAAQFNIDNTASAAQAVVALHADGSFIVAWHEGTTTTSVLARQYDANGAAISSAATVNTTLTGPQQDAAIAMDSSGNYVIVWWGEGTGDSDGIFGQKFTASGSPVGSEFAINQTSGGMQEMPSIALLDTDNFVVVWSGNGPGDSDGVFARQFGTGSVNSAPVAANDSFTVAEDTTLTVATPGVLANDTDADGNSLSAVLVSGPANGSLTLNADGSFTYTPSANWNGTDSFTYKVSDGIAESNVATATITVTAVNDAPSLGNGVLASIAQDTADPPGAALSDIFSGQFSDVDVGAAFAGVAVVGNSANPLTEGRWQYSTDGVNWFNIGSVGDGPSALALDFATRIRFVPAAGFTGVPAALVVRGLDDTYAGGFSATSGSESRVTVDTTANGGATPIAAAVSQASTSVIPTAAGAFLWLSTDGNVGSSGAPGLGAWNAGEILQFGNPNLSLEPGTTSGTFSSAFNLDAFGGNVNIDAMHYVSRNLTVGTGVNAINLLRGDLLLSSADAETLTSLNTLSVTKDEVFIFRPASPGDYSSGTFILLLDDFGTVHGGGDTWALTLVEQATTVGDVTLGSGTFLFGRSGGAEDNDIYYFVPSGVGAGATTGTTVVLVEGDQLNIGSKIAGLELLETTTNLANRTLSAGSLLVSVDADDNNVGTNSIAVTKHDVFVLTVSQTTLGSGTAVASAEVIFQGADVGLGGAAEALDALTLYRQGNPPPVAAGDSYTVNEDTPLTVSNPGVLANDTDADGNSLSAVLVSGPANGSLTLNADGSFTYTPSANWNGTDSFTYKVSDGITESNVATVTITVNSVNDAPDNTVPAPQATLMNTPLTFSAANGNLVAVTDADALGTDTFTVSLTAADGTITLATTAGLTFLSGADGTAAMTFSGTLVAINQALDGMWYQPAAGFTGATFLTITADDLGNRGGGGNATDTDVINISVGALATPFLDLDADDSSGAVGNDYVGSFVEDNPAVNIADALDATITDTDSAALQWLTVTITNVRDGANEVLTADTSGTSITGSYSGGVLTLTGLDSVSNYQQVLRTVRYQNTSQNPDPVARIIEVVASDAEGNLGNTVTATLAITSVNDNPMITSGTAPSVLENATFVQIVTATDPEGGPVTFSIAGGSDQAFFSLDPVTGVLAFLAPPSFENPQDFNRDNVYELTVRAIDADGGSGLQTIGVTVANVNDNPSASPDAYVTNRNNALVVAGPGVLTNDADEDGDMLVPILVSSTSNGVLLFNADGSFVYTPNRNFVGTDSFTYRVTDGVGISNTATVTITVNPANTPPVAADDAYFTAEDTPLVVWAPGLLANDADADGDMLTAELVSGPAYGTLNFNADGTFVYLPGMDFNGTDAFIYRAKDGTTYSSPAVVYIAVAPVDDFPLALPDQYAASSDSVLTVGALGVLANDYDADGDTLSAVLVQPPTVGTLTLNPDGSFTYVPPAGFRGTVAFAYKVVTSGAESNTVVVNITVVASARQGGELQPDQPPDQAHHATPNETPAAEASYSTAEATPALSLGSGTVMASPRDAVAAADRATAPPVNQAAALLVTAATRGRGDDRGASSGGFGAIQSGEVSIHVESFLAPRPPPLDVSPKPAEEVGSAMARHNPVLLPLDVPAYYEDGRRGAPTSIGSAATGTLAATGLMATAGYVLLNTRTVAWLLTFLVSQPAWKQFDPLEVIYSWEDRRESSEDEEDESLVSLVK